MPRHPLSTTVRFRKLHESVELPSQETGSFILRAYLPDGVQGISPHEWQLIRCGFQVETEEGYTVDIRSLGTNSPIALGFEISPEVTVLLYNGDSITQVLKHGDPVANMQFLATARVAIVLEPMETY